MFYNLERGKVGFITFEELRKTYQLFHFPEKTLDECKGNLYNFRSNTYVSDDLIFLVLDMINLLDVFGEKNRVALYIKRDLCLIVEVKDANGTVKRLFEQVVNRYEESERGLKNTIPEKFLYYFLDGLIVDDKKFLENMEFHMSHLETKILKEAASPVFINEILTFKKELMYIWNYYEQLIDVGEVLKDNENEMFPKTHLRRFEIFTERVHRLSGNVKYLKEYTVQLQEMHDAMMDYNLNNIMKFFTVITTIFSPLSLIVGWYGMNFVGMPELTWEYGYYVVIVFSILVIIFCIFLFKKYKLL